MLRTLCVTALLLSATKTEAQVSFSFTNFVNVANGFNTTLLIRNINQYSDATIIGIVSPFRLTTSAKIQTFCAFPILDCNVGSGGSPTYLSGNVQGNFSTSSGGTFLRTERFFEDSCGGNYCLSRTYFSQGGVGLLGCQIPNSPFIQEHAGRTCAADGFTGALALDVTFRYAAINPVSITFDLSDINATFNTRTFVGPAAFVIPEPATWALMAFGLLAVGVVRRRRACLHPHV